MRFCAISSGSSGNCTFIETQEHRLLIDVGLSARTIEGMLKEKKNRADSAQFFMITAAVFLSRLCRR